jgi:hypothetical protein
MNTKSNRKNASKSLHVAKGPLKTSAPAETPINVIVETGATTPVEIVTPAPVVETPAPVIAAVPAATPAEKVEWEDTMKKAQASFAKNGSFREGTNRAVMYPLLCRDQGMSLQEAVAAIASVGRVRKLNTVQTDLHDIAKITDRKLIRCDRGEVKAYRLATVAPVVAPVVAETEKEEVK